MEQQRATPAEIKEFQRLFLTTYYTLPEDEQAALAAVIHAVANWEEPQKRILLRFMEWSAAREWESRADKRDNLMVLAAACTGNKTAWGVIKATVEEAEFSPMNEACRFSRSRNPLEV